MSDEIVKKGPNFWDTKEGTWGMIIGIAVIAGLGYAFFQAIPFILAGLKMAAMAGFYGVAVIGLFAIALALIYVLFIDDSLRNAAMLRYKAFIRALYRSIIASDPISILKECKAACKERREKVRTKRDAVAANVRQNDEVLKSFQSQAKELEGEVTHLRSKNRPEDAMLLQSKAAQLGKLIQAGQRCVASGDKIKALYDTVNRGYKALEIMDSNIDFDISLLEREYKSANAANSAMKSVRDALLKGEFMDDIQNEAIAYITEEYGRMLGEADAWMDDIDNVVKGIEGKQEMLADNVLRQIDEVNGFNFSTFTERPALEHKPVVTVPAVVVQNTGSYAGLIKK